MPRKKKDTGVVDAALPAIPKELLDQFVTGPITAESVEAVMRQFKKAIIERALGAEMTHLSMPLEFPHFFRSKIPHPWCWAVSPALTVFPPF